MTIKPEDAWFTTYTGKKFYPLAPRIEDIDIIDIAHALSLECRYGNHSIFHYSVAQHSCYVALLSVHIELQKSWAPSSALEMMQIMRSVSLSGIPASGEPEAVLARSIGIKALMHDASEAYLGDMTRPVRELIRQHLGDALEQAHHRLQALIAERYGFAPAEPELVTEIDRRLCRNEAQRVLRKSPLCDDENYAPLDESDWPPTVDLARAWTWTPSYAEERFLQLFYELQQ